MNGLTLAFTTMRRSPYQALAAIIIVTVTFFMGYSFSVLGIWGNQLIAYAQAQQEIIAFFVEGTTEEEISAITTQLDDREYVESYQVETQEEALRNYLEDNVDNPLLTELVTAEMLPASIAVSGINIAALEQIYSELDSLSIVEEVSYQEEVSQTLESWISSLQLVGVVVVGLLAFSSFLTITVLSAMKAAIQKYSIKVMRQIGATRWYIKSPFILEGIIYGLLGSLIGWSMQYLLLLYITPYIQQFQGEIAFVPISLELLLVQLGVGLAIGISLGGFAGLAAVNRLIRR